MADLNFNSNEVWEDYLLRDDEKGDTEIKIKDINDRCFHYQNKSYDIDVFYGNKKIILLIRANQRSEFVKDLEDKSNWKKDGEETKKKQKIKIRKGGISIRNNGINNQKL
jgi:hypothetical protein